MEGIIFEVKGSAAEPYKVTFIRNNTNVSALCTCPAGQNGRWCKHRLAILAGESKAVVSSNEDEVMTVKSWLPGTALEEALMELTAAEHEFSNASKRLSAAKRNVARAMR